MKFLKYQALFLFVFIMFSCSESEFDSSNELKTEEAENLAYDAWIEAGNVGSLKAFEAWVKSKFIDNSENSEVEESDIDADGIPDEFDPCPENAERFQILYADNDGDGLGDPNSSKFFCPNESREGYVLNTDDLDDYNSDIVFYSQIRTIDTDAPGTLVDADSVVIATGGNDDFVMVYRKSEWVWFQEFSACK